MAVDAIEPGGWTRGDGVNAVISLLLGIAPILFIVLEWSVAWWTLGRRPLLTDDPKWIGGVVPFLHWLSLLSSGALFLVFPWSSFYWVARHGGSRTGQMVALGCLLFPFCSLIILCSSSFEPIGWWLD